MYISACLIILIQIFSYASEELLEAVTFKEILFTLFDLYNASSAIFRSLEAMYHA